LDELDNLPDASDDEIYWTLKQMIKMKKTISNNNTKLKNKLHAQLLHHYPNYKDFFCKIDNIAALDFWQTFPNPSMIKDLTPEEIKERLITKGKFPLYKANTILLLIKGYDYKNTIYQDNRDMLIKTIVKNIKANNEQLVEMENQIIELYDKLDIQLHTFIGLTKISSAEIVSEIGNINRFANSAKLAKYCGIAPVNFSSGNHDKTMRNEYGNRHLNGYIYYLSCRSICTGRAASCPHNPIFLDYYYKKIEEGKTKRQALTCVMRRIINIIYKILKYIFKKKILYVILIIILREVNNKNIILILHIFERNHKHEYEYESKNGSYSIKCSYSFSGYYISSNSCIRKYKRKKNNEFCQYYNRRKYY